MRRFSTAIILVPLSLIVGILLGEWLLAQLSPQLSQVPRVWQFDSALGWNHIPSASGRLVTPEFDVEVRINADALRDRDYSMSKRGNTQRILLFGDSFAEGWGVEIERSVGRALENSLNQRSVVPQPCEVLNFGVAGFGTDQELLLFKQKGRRYDPDVVILLFYGNDLWNNISRRGIGAERGEKPYFRTASDRLVLDGVPVSKNRYWEYREGTLPLPWSVRTERYFVENWHGFALLKKAFAASEVSAGQQQTFYDGLYGTKRNFRHETSWELTAKLIEAFRAATKAEESEFVLVYVPSIVQIDDDDWQMKRELHQLVGDEFDLLKPNRFLGEIATASGMNYLDLYPPFRSTSELRTLYYRDSHWNAAGHALAATQIAEFLTRKGLASGSRAQ